MIFPPCLQPGDTIGIVSPSWGGPAFFPHRLERGIQQLERMGYRVKVGAHAANQHGFVSDTAENRADDLHTFFADPEVRAIIASIGGDHACHLLPHLDFELIRQNPKILMGFSDITVLNVATYTATGLVTFNGPALMTDFAEYPDILAYTLRSFQHTLTEAEPVGVIEPAQSWTEEFMDWEQKKDLERPRQMQPSPGWTWLKAGQGEGKLIGGCIESLQHLRGTRFWPDWDGAILFFETSEDKPSPATVDGILMDYENMGVLEKLRGMLVGRPISYSAEEKLSLREVILERTRAFSFPIITDMDFGHTSPQFILPVGCLARINSDQKRLELTQAAVK